MGAGEDACKSQVQVRQEGLVWPYPVCCSFTEVSLSPVAVCSHTGKLEHQHSHTGPSFLGAAASFQESLLLVTCPAPYRLDRIYCIYVFNHNLEGEGCQVRMEQTEVRAGEDACVASVSS